MKPKRETGMDFVYRNRPSYGRVRRIFDATVAAVIIFLVLPVLVVACVAILIEDGHPMFFTQRRVGRFERLFTIYKLRTMSQALCGDALSPVGGTDRRITRVGKWLRKTSIDELPQLFNVLRGDMSLIGPRPEMPFIVARYEPWQHLRHLAMPGITGLWQTTCRSEIPLHRPEATLLDLQYIRERSPRNDGKILINTVRAVFGSKGAY